MKKLLLTLALATTSSLGTAAAAHAQTVIDHLPYTITTKGLYVLTQDFNSTQTTAGILIDIEASNVTLDFQGHYIAGPVGNTSLDSIGVYADERSNVVVRNGTVAYCSTGIILVGNGSANTNAIGALVEDMRVTYCSYEGIALAYCPSSRIENCQVSQTGLSGTDSAYGIYAVGSDVTVLNNTVSTVTATNSYGVYAPVGFARRNTTTRAGFGVLAAKYQDNLTLNCTTPFSGGTDAGGNN